ncbi:hypothetical protein ATCC90586_009817 [Pythium insidiosum]|nr:hypothetical protein ATCC90586_009817 [Pythium insidiosum]
MATVIIVGIVGTSIAMIAVILIVLFLRWVSQHNRAADAAFRDHHMHRAMDTQRTMSLPTHMLFSEPGDVYREELNDSFMEQALWRCGVCRFGNHPDRKIEYREDHLAYFEFAGRLLGKAILEEHLMTVHLALPFLKHILDGIEPVTRELVPGGSEIDVTMSNKSVYLDALFKYYGLLKLFDYQELELLMCGVPTIDVDDWRKHTDFKFFTEDLPTELELQNIQWLWEVITEMKNEDRVRLLQFATGTSRVPAQGFKGLISSDGRVRQFNVAFTGENPDILFPKAHTCFNRLDLPIYSSKDQMSEYMKLIVEMDITGFSIE